ncbi:MAG TPA: hypothetical protein VHC22_29085 [Pirellulales bacterium]|nr:hypothetical protein [Pirellulales bacterium]
MTTDHRHRITSSAPAALICILAHTVIWPSVASADAGTIRASQRNATYQVTVFTDPTPLRAGPVDVSVFVQDANTGQPILGNSIDIEIAPRGLPSEQIRIEATSAAASNKLFQAANFDLPHAGWWTFTVDVHRPSDSMRLQFELDAADTPPTWISLWPWFGWPFFAIALFAVSSVFRPTRTARPSSAAASDQMSPSTR